ncbi:type IV secretion system protein VirB7 [Bartonella sp. CB189]|uniref:type IV secretion system protein VirB7 n=1 Tax=Bartonella sp. CB189 TaxID=3112254 RepID=UPI002F9643B3
MKLKITAILTLAISLSGCASLNSSTSKKLPRCDGQYTRALNKDKWNWDNTNSTLQKTIIQPVTAPVIIGTLKSGEQKKNTVFKVASLNLANHEALSYRNCGGRT